MRCSKGAASLLLGSVTAAASGVVFLVHQAKTVEGADGSLRVTGLTSDGIEGKAADSGILSYSSSSRHPDDATTADFESDYLTIASGVGGISGSRVLVPAIASCEAGYVDCVNGLDPNGTSCVQACGSGCCQGAKSCTSFTGKICKDGSCNATRACFEANIPLVVNSCLSDQSCFRAGKAGIVGNIVNSCQGKDSCNSLGIAGTVGYLQDSCNFKKSCWQAGFQGTIGSMKNSCDAQYACYKLAKDAGNTISNIYACCSYSGSPTAAPSPCANVNSTAFLPIQCLVRFFLVIPCRRLVLIYFVRSCGFI